MLKNIRKFYFLIQNVALFCVLKEKSGLTLSWLKNLNNWYKTLLGAIIKYASKKFFFSERQIEADTLLFFFFIIVTR